MYCESENLQQCLGTTFAAFFDTKSGMGYTSSSVVNLDVFTKPVIGSLIIEY